VACERHNIKDVYILEHRNCGAYKVFLNDAGDFDDSETGQYHEREKHEEYALKLAGKIKAWSAENGRSLQVRCLLMDLRGQVELLGPSS
jgi:carbonic anhydrase